MSYVKLNNPVIDRLPFLFLGCFLCWAETFWFDIVLLIYFSFHCLCFWCLTQKKSLPRPLSKGFFSMFSSRSSMTSGITCNSVTHFEFFFESGPSSILLHEAIQFSHHHLLKRLSSPHCVFLVPLSKVRKQYIHRFTARLSILFHWSLCLLLYEYH